MKEQACKRLRKNKEYYLNELKQNAKRGREKYNRDLDKVFADKQKRKEYQNKTGVYRKMKKWTLEEIDYIEENYQNKTILEMALYLKRSWVSVEHKLNRLNLTNYHKYKEENNL